MEEQGVADLCRTIADDAAAQAAETLRLAEEKASARTRRAEEEASRAAAETLRQGEAAAALESKRILSKVQLESRKMELCGRERLIDEVMARVRRRLSGLHGEPGYPALLRRLAVEGARELGEREIELVLSPGDAKLFDADALREIGEALAREGIAGASVSVAGEATPGTGVIVRARSGRVAVDNTLEARIGRRHRELRVLISKTLFG